MTHSQWYNNPEFNSKIRSKWTRREAKWKGAKHLIVGWIHSLVHCSDKFLHFRFFIFDVVKSRKYFKNTIPLRNEKWLFYCMLDNDSLQSIKVFERLKMSIETNMKIVHRYQISNGNFFITFKWILAICLTHANLCARHFWLLAICSTEQSVFTLNERL